MAVLTPRQIEVLQLVADGLPNRVIARRLGIEVVTVKNHMYAINERMGARNRVDAVVRGIQQGLLRV